MGPGIALLVAGALLTFAVEDHVPNLNLDAAGVILMIAGGVVLAFSRGILGSERTVTRREESTDPGTPTHVVQETVRKRRTDDDRPE